MAMRTMEWGLRPLRKAEAPHMANSLCQHHIHRQLLGLLCEPQTAPACRPTAVCAPVPCASGASGASFPACLVRARSLCEPVGALAPSLVCAAC